MAEEPTFDQYERTIEQLREAWPKYHEQARHPNCDKKGIGFNQDDRFSALRFELSFDSWLGYFGQSGSHIAVGFASPALVKRALLRYLNAHWRSIFEEIAADLERESAGLKAKQIAKLEAELERLRA